MTKLAKRRTKKTQIEEQYPTADDVIDKIRAAYLKCNEDERGLFLLITELLLDRITSHTDEENSEFGDRFRVVARKPYVSRRARAEALVEFIYSNG